MATDLITQSELHRLLSYDPDTGVFVWRVSASYRVMPGQQAGTISHKGYIKIQCRTKMYLAHRLAWLYMTGEWPPAQIDHINRQKGDNRFANLRAVSASQNVRNTGIRSDNTSGYKGVSFWAHQGKWASQLRVADKNHLLGMFETPEAAHNRYRQEALDRGLEV